MKAIIFTPAALKQLSKLPQPVREQIKAKLTRYADSGAGDVRALVGEAAARLRVGDYRVIFEETETALEVIAVGHRREIYS